MTAESQSRLGRLVAETLQRSWTGSHLAPDFSEKQLDEVTSLLYESGAAGLGWWRIRESELRRTPSGELLHQAYRFLALHARIHETKIQKIFRLLRAASIEPILIKGCSIARHYPQPGLRPYGDVDLLIKPEQHLHAADVA